MGAGCISVKSARPESAPAQTDAERLVEAAYRGDLEIVTRLIESGVDVNSRWHDGARRYFANAEEYPFPSPQWTGLHAAGYMQHVGVVERLLQAGADVEADDGGGGTVLFYAVENYEHSCQNVALVRLLLAAGARPNVRVSPVLGTRDVTPLHRAVVLNCVETVDVLLKAGADPTLRDANGETPMAYAVALGARRIVELLKNASPGE
jgi:ankyrin repeat protein